MNKTFQTKLFVAVALFALTASTATARSWRIHHDAAQKADFVSINAAMSSNDVMAGDTLYMDPGCTLSAAQTVTKQVTIVGSGYLRSDSPHNFAYITGSLTIKAANTKVEGMNLQGNTYVHASSCTIERCQITSNISIGTSSYTAQNVAIRQCYISSYIDGYGKTSEQSSNAVIENCIIIHNSPKEGISNLKNPTIRNNYIKITHSSSSNYCCIQNVSNASIINNIMFHENRTSYVLGGNSNSIISHNVILRGSAYAEYPENIYMGSTDESVVFALEGANDQKYQLKADSPAKGYAMDDGDCGPYGGLYPYVPNGLPANYPYFTKAVIGTRAKDGKVNVSLNIKMQDE